MTMSMIDATSIRVEGWGVCPRKCSCQGGLVDVEGLGAAGLSRRQTPLDVEVLLVVLGAFVGAVATGGVTAWDAWRQRRVRRRVAARLILGDLYVVEAAVELTLEQHRWPDRLDLESPLQTWRDAREAFADGVKAWEWALVDGLFSDLHRTARMVRLGEPCTQSDEKVLTSFLDRVPRARGVVIEHSTSADERDQLMKQLGQRATS